jgi:SsrA-binding protein
LAVSCPPQPTGRREQDKQGWRDPAASGRRDAAVNRAATHNYSLLDKCEAGIAPHGTDWKSIRSGRADLS